MMNQDNEHPFEHQLPKLGRRVRFPSSAYKRNPVIAWNPHSYWVFTFLLSVKNMVFQYRKWHFGVL